MMEEKKVVPKVSVIIPVYRTEAYLQECIVSVLRQNYENLEVLLVDDGSPDGCPALCDRYAGQYKQIKTFHQENKGLGAARNTGLKKAGGEFILFLDSDDLLNRPDAIRKLVKTALEAQADIVAGNYRRFQGERYGPVNRHHLQSGDYTKTADFHFRGFLAEGHLIMDWGKLYRKDFLLKNQLWCKRRIHMEDKLRNMMCCTYEPVYAFVEDCICLYRITEDSITQQYRERAKELERDWLYVTKCFYHFLKERGQLEQFGDLLAFHVFCGIFTIGRMTLQDGKKRKTGTVRILKEYGGNPLVRHILFELARGKYLKGVRSPFWKILIWGGSILFYMGAYRMIAWGIFLLQGLGTEKKESRLKKD